MTFGDSEITRQFHYIGYVSKFVDSTINISFSFFNKDDVKYDVMPIKKFQFICDKQIHDLLYESVIIYSLFACVLSIEKLIRK